MMKSCKVEPLLNIQNSCLLWNSTKWWRFLEYLFEINFRAVKLIQ